MTLPTPLRLALRELRGGLAGFRVFLACLALGVAAIAAVGSVRAAIEAGLAREAAALLGGDAEVEFTYRFAGPAERAWMAENAEAVSEIVDFRSMAVVERSEGGPERTLVQVKAVDALHPLYGAVELAGGGALAEALAPSDDLPGLVADRVLIDRLGLAPGDVVRLGTADFRLADALVGRARRDRVGLRLRAAGDRAPGRSRGERPARRGLAVRFVLPAAAGAGRGPRARFAARPRRASPRPGCNGATGATARRGSIASWSGWRISWC